MSTFQMHRLEVTSAAVTIHCSWPVDGATISEPLLSEFESLVVQLEDDFDLPIIVLRGLGGDRVLHGIPNFHLCRRWEKALSRFDHLPAVTIAVVDGVCAEYSLQLALACDLRIATTRSKLCVPEVQSGYLPGSHIFRLGKLAGSGVARQVIFSGEPVAASQAYNWGIFNKLSDSDSVEEVVSQTIDRLSAVKPEAILLARRMLDESFSICPEEYIGHYLAAQYRCISKNADGPSDRHSS